MIYQKTLQNVIFPAATKVMKRDFWTKYRELEKLQWTSKKNLEALQLKKLKLLVNHAYDTVQLYKELMKKNKVTPADIISLKDITKLPIVTKKDFREGFPKRCTSDKFEKKELMFDSTSGSTGTPFQFIRDKNFSDYSLASTMLNYTWTGTQIGDKIIGLWGYHKAPLGAKYFDMLLRKKYLSSFDVEIKYKEYYKEIKKYKPHLIEAYSASITQFAKLLNEDKITDLHVPAVISSAETLYPKNRALIEKTIHTEVYDRYGSREAGNVAHECNKHRGLHINSPCYIVEVIKNKPSDKHGRIIVTNLTNFAMPFIRYDTEDYSKGIIQNCTCGRTSPMLDGIDGRVTDYIKLSNNKELSNLFFNYFFEQYGAYLKQFQIIQDKANHIYINLVITNKYNLEKEKELLEGISKKVGKNMKITINKVKTIQKEKSGKTRTVKRLI